MSEWHKTTLGQLIASGNAHLQTGPFGTALKAEEYVKEGVPLISVREIREGYFEIGQETPRISPETAKRLPKFVLEKGDIVFARKGGIDRNAIVTNRHKGWFLGSDGIRLRLSAEYHSLFFSYQVRSSDSRTWLLQNSEGTTMPSLNQEILGRLPITIVPLPEQRAIAHVLGSLDDKIELNRQMNETLEEMARTLFRSWFVDFDPVHAKSEGRQPDGMDAETAVLFPSEFVESEPGMIPNGWVMTTVNDVATINARTLSKNDTLDRIRYIEISEVQRGEIGSIAEYERGEEPSRARRRLQHGDTAMSTVRPDRGAYFLAHHPEEDLIASTGFAVLTPQTVPWAFLFLGLTQPEVFTYLGHIADGGAYPAINPGAIGDLRLVLPDESILQAFSETVTPILEQMEVARQESRHLTALRDELLPMLISGEIRLPEGMIEEFQN